MEINCNNCQRQIGPEVLGCNLQSSDKCPFKISHAKNYDQLGKDTAFTLIVIGIAIFILTYLFSIPSHDASAKSIVAEAIISTFLYVLGIFAVLVGYFSIVIKKTTIFNPISKDTYEYYGSGGVEFYSKLISNWKPLEIKLDQTYNFNNTELNIIEASNHKEMFFTESECKKHKERYSKLAIEILEAATISLILQGKVTAYTAQVYSSKGQSIDSICDAKQVFVLCNSLASNETGLQKIMLETLAKLQKSDQLNIPVSIEAIVKSLLLGPNSKLYNFFQLIKKETNGLYSLNKEDFLHYQNKYDELKISTPNFFITLNRDLSKEFSSYKNPYDQVIQYATGPKGIKNIRISIVVIAIACFSLLRIYFPISKLNVVADAYESTKYTITEKTNNTGVFDSIGSKYDNLKYELTRSYDQIKDYFHDSSNNISDGISDRFQEIKDKKIFENFKKEVILALESQDIDLKLRAIDMISSMGPEGAFAGSVLIKLLDDENIEVSKKSATVLGDIVFEPETVVPLLEEKLNDPNYPGQSAIKTSLNKYEKYIDLGKITEKFK